LSCSALGVGVSGASAGTGPPPSRAIAFATSLRTAPQAASGLLAAVRGGGGAAVATGSTSPGTSRRSVRRQMSFQIDPLHVRTTSRTSIYDTGSAGFGASPRAPVIQNHRQLRQPHSGAWLIPRENSFLSQPPPRRTASGGPLLASAVATAPPPKVATAVADATADASDGKASAPLPQRGPITRLRRRMSAPSSLHQLRAVAERAAGSGSGGDSYGRCIGAAATATVAATTRAASGTKYLFCGGTIGTASSLAALEARSNWLVSGTTSGGGTSGGGMNAARSGVASVLSGDSGISQSRTQGPPQLLLVPAAAAAAAVPGATAALPSATNVSCSGAIQEASIGSAVTAMRLMEATAEDKYGSSRPGGGGSGGGDNAAYSGHVPLTARQSSGSTAKSNLAMTLSLPPLGSISQKQPPPPPPSVGKAAALLAAGRASGWAGGQVDAHVSSGCPGESSVASPSSASPPRHGRSLGSGSRSHNRPCRRRYRRGMSYGGVQESVTVDRTRSQEDGGKQEEEEEEEEECWHEMWALRSVDPITGQPVIVLSQTDVTAKVVAERHVAQVMEAEHRLLEQLFPRHILQYMAEEWTSKQFRRRLQQQRVGSSATAAVVAAAAERPVVRDCNALATLHPQVTLLFADIKGFTPMCKEVEPRVVMSMLNELYSRYDKMLDQFGVFKVETIGDCYFVAGGLIAEDEDGMAAVRGEGSRADPLHAYKVFAFAKAMLAAAREVPMPTTREPVQIRIGIHTGPVVSGIAGTRMPRFCLFGDTVNTASRMESTGVPGAVHATEAARKLLPDEGWVATDGVEVKGKGLMQTYLWRHPDASELPPLSITAAGVGRRVAGGTEEGGDGRGSDEGRWGSSITSSGTGGGEGSQCRTSRIQSRSQRRRPHPAGDSGVAGDAEIDMKASVQRKSSLAQLLREELFRTNINTNTSIDMTAGRSSDLESERRAGTAAMSTDEAVLVAVLLSSGASAAALGAAAAAQL
ncbi:hypothetical protein Vretimale_7199, partial [Volvox reticuliferus]